MLDCTARSHQAAGSHGWKYCLRYHWGERWTWTPLCLTFLVYKIDIRPSCKDTLCLILLVYSKKFSVCFGEVQPQKTRSYAQLLLTPSGAVLNKDGFWSMASVITHYCFLTSIKVNLWSSMVSTCDEWNGIGARAKVRDWQGWFLALMCDETLNVSSVFSVLSGLKLG